MSDRPSETQQFCCAPDGFECSCSACRDPSTAHLGSRLMMRHRGWTSDGSLRHPTFKGVRED